MRATSDVNIVMMMIVEIFLLRKIFEFPSGNKYWTCQNAERIHSSLILSQSRHFKMSEGKSDAVEISPETCEKITSY